MRPSHGRIPSGTHADIQVVMVNEPTRADKFLIKHVTVAHSLPHGDFLKQFQEAEGSARERRLRVVLLGASSTSDGTGARENGERKDSIVDTESHSGSMVSLHEGSSGASSASLELREARSKIAALTSKNQELTKALDEAKVIIALYHDDILITHPFRISVVDRQAMNLTIRQPNYHAASPRRNLINY